VGGATLLTGILVKRFLPRLPYMIAAMIVGGATGVALSSLAGPDVTGIHTVGALPGALPPLSHPVFSAPVWKQLAGSAFAVTMLALTEAVSIARAIAVRSEQRIDGSQEFIGQGLANVLGSFFSSYASSGSFNRSGLNYEAGARTPLAAVFASFVLAAVLLLVAPLAAYLPVAAMAGILLLVGWGLVDVHHIRAIMRASRSETAVLAATFLATLLLDLEFAIYVGVLLSLGLYLHRTSRPLVRALAPDGADPGGVFSTGAELPECSQLKIVEVHGSLFFGAVDHVQQRLQEIDERNPQQKHVLVVADSINFADIAGAEMLTREARRRRRMGGGLYLVGVKERTLETLRGAYLSEIGEENVFASKAQAIVGIRERLDPAVCDVCQQRVFAECRSSLPARLAEAPAQRDEPVPEPMRRSGTGGARGSGTP
jgi:SulP family sulfate permease